MDNSSAALLKGFFKPRSVAIVGASREDKKVGFAVIDNLIKLGFKGKIYPVNPKADEILGVKSYASLTDLPKPVDLAVFAVPSKLIPPSVRDLPKIGIHHAVVISAGFKEIGESGAKIENDLVRAARESDVRIIGPNCLGIIDTFSSLNVSFSRGTPKRGGVSFFSQSGALGTAVLDWAIGENVGLAKFISLGNKADIGEMEALQMLAEDPETDVIIGYIEGVESGRRFIEVGREVSRKKPVLIMKAGCTKAGARAASSHTGTLAGSDAAYDAAFKQAGIIRVNTVEEFFDWAGAFSSKVLPEHENICIVTNAGGPGIIATDAVERSRLKIASLDDGTIERLREKLPPTAALHNPVDVIGDADGKRYEDALGIVLEDKNVASVLVLLTPQSMTNDVEIAQIVTRIAKDNNKPIFTCFMGGPSVHKGTLIFADERIPHYNCPERAVRSMEAAHNYASYLKSEKPKMPPRYEVDKDKVSKIFQAARKRNQLQIGESIARDVLIAYGFALPQNRIVKTEEEAVKTAQEFGYPLVLKVVSPQIMHKSDAGGVRLNIHSEADLRKAFQDIMTTVKRRMPQAQVEGIDIQQMVVKGREVILGSSRDPQFGHLIMFGLGGVYVEVLKDVSFRVAPVTVGAARAMVQEIKTYPLLKGVRGEKPVDFDALYEAIFRLSQLVTDFPEIEELDINPIKLFPEDDKGAIALDARIALSVSQ